MDWELSVQERSIKFKKTSVNGSVAAGRPLRSRVEARDRDMDGSLKAMGQGRDEDGIDEMRANLAHISQILGCSFTVYSGWRVLPAIECHRAVSCQMGQSHRQPSARGEG